MSKTAAAKRYADVMKRSNRTQIMVATSLWVVMALSVGSRPRALLWLAGTFLSLIPLNAWITHVALDRWGPRAELVRIGVNTAVGLLMNHMIGWPLAVWFWLPYIAVTFDAFVARTNWITLGAACAAHLVVSRHDGVPWVTSGSFTALAILCRVLTESRLASIRQMFVESDEHRAELDHAHEELKREVAARERAERELRHSQKLEAVGRLAAGVAHEINTPLQFVTNSAQFVQEGVAELLEATRTCCGPHQKEIEYLAENLPEATSMILDGVGKVSAIVATLKEFAHPRQGSFAKADVNHAVEQALLITKHEHKYVANVEKHLGEVPLVSCDVGELNQALLNVIVNAGHAIADVVGNSGKMGLISVTTALTDPGEVTISISDTGCGIPEIHRDKIFDPFFTTKEIGRGTGQGLALTRALLVDKHGARIDFESTVGAGTTFHIRLRVDAATRKAA